MKEAAVKTSNDLQRAKQSLEQLRTRQAQLRRELQEIDKLLANAEYEYSRAHMNSLLNQHEHE
jgi:hypothetical protein